MKARVPLALLLTVLLAGCPAPDSSTSADQRRLDVLKQEPLAAKGSAPFTKVGFEISAKLPPKRGQLLTTLVDTAFTDPAPATRAHVADAAATLRSGGWTVYFAFCLPPSTTSSPAPTSGRPVLPAAKPDSWTFGAYAYRHVDSVAYFAAVTGSSADGKARVVLELLAPNSHEKQPDIFPDRPAAAAASCLDTPDLPATSTTTGTALIANTDGPDPATGTPFPQNR